MELLILDINKCRCGEQATKLMVIEPNNKQYTHCGSFCDVCAAQCEREAIGFPNRPLEN